jgi:hypothetical protein
MALAVERVSAAPGAGADDGNASFGGDSLIQRVGIFAG